MAHHHGGRTTATTDPVFNVPIITEEQERVERESLTELEQLQLDLDLYGATTTRTTGGLQQQKEDLSGSIQTKTSQQQEQERTLPSLPPNILVDTTSRGSVAAALHQALEAIPMLEKADYLRAKEEMPNVIEEESSPVDFWELLWKDGFSDYNPSSTNAAAAAANRLVSYWSQRRRIFGNELAFLPLRLDGALRDDIDFLEQGFLVPLSNDKHGRPVILLDRTSVSKLSRDNATTSSVLRVLMYLAHVVASRDNQQRQQGDHHKRRFVLLTNMQGLDLRGKIEKFRFFAKQEIAMYDTLPMTMASHHIFTGPGRSPAAMILPALKYIYGKHVRLRTRLHSGTAQETTSQVKEFGLNEDHVQLMYGSQADRKAKMQEWIKEQRRKEELGEAEQTSG